MDSGPIMEVGKCRKRIPAAYNGEISAIAEPVCVWAYFRKRHLGDKWRQVEVIEIMLF